MIERQEIHCHNCGQYVQFDIDNEQSGNLVLPCPVCGHEHCRVVEDGKISDRRWDQRNGNLYTYTSVNVVQSVSVSNVSSSSRSTYDNYTTAYPKFGSTANSSSSVFLYSSWMNATT